MKKTAVILCCLSLAISVATASDKTKATTTLSAKPMSENPVDHPERHVVSNGQPDEAVLKKLAEAGYSAIIDIRGANENRGLEEQRIVEALGMTYLAFPIVSEDDISFENAATLDKMLAGIDGPVLVHCASGNRVGALFALRARNNGASNEDAMAIGKAEGMTRLERLVRERLEID